MKSDEDDNKVLTQGFLFPFICFFLSFLVSFLRESRKKTKRNERKRLLS